MNYKKSYIKKCNSLMINPLTVDELVELCKNLPKYKDKSYLNLLSNFRLGISKMFCSSYLETQNLHELLLFFYVHEISGKVWYEGKNKWL
jgi:hypothetical protein